MSIRCKAFVCVGVLAVAGIIAVILWKTLGAQSTSNETEHTKNHTENGKTIENDQVKGTSPPSGNKISSDNFWPLKATENESEHIQEDESSTYSDISHRNIKKYTSDIAGQESESSTTSPSNKNTPEKISDMRIGDETPSSSQFSGQVSSSPERPVEERTAILDLMKGKEFLVTDEFINQLKTEINSKQLLSPANQINYTLANLKSISQQMAEIRIGVYAPEGGFKYIKWPDSFRATTVQLDNAGSRTISNAQSTVDTFSRLAYSFLDYVKQARNILKSGDEQSIKAFLPQQLKGIQQNAEEVLANAQSVVTQLNYFFNFAKEVQEATKTITFRQPDDWPLFQNGLVTLLDETVKMRDGWTKLTNFFQNLKNI